MLDYLFKARSWTRMELLSYIDLLLLDIDAIWLVIKLITRYILYAKCRNMIRRWDRKNPQFEKVKYLLECNKLFKHSKNAIKDFEDENYSSLNIPNWIHVKNEERIFSGTLKLLESYWIKLYEKLPTATKPVINLNETKWARILTYVHFIQKFLPYTKSMAEYRLGNYYEGILERAWYYESYWYLVLRKRHMDDHMNIYIDYLRTEKGISPEVLKELWLKENKHRYFGSQNQYKTIEDFALMDSFLMIIKNYQLNEKKRWTEDAEIAFQALQYQYMKDRQKAKFIKLAHK
jgi:hypothetical protein